MASFSGANSVTETELRFANAEEARGAIPILPVRSAGVEAWINAQPAHRATWLHVNAFDASDGTSLCLPGPDGGMDGVAFGVGRGEWRGLVGRRFGGLPLSLPEGVYRIDTPPEDTQARELAALGWLLGSYSFDSYRKPKRRPARLVAPEGIDTDRVLRLARGMFLARDLINTPTEDLGPEQLERAIRDVGQALGASVTSIVGDELLSQNFPMIHAVGRAGPQAPRLIELRWTPPEPARMSVTLVGKGVCFDTGGLDLKPSAAMLLMKKDMGGSACALALAAMIMEAGLPIQLRLLVPSVENSVSSDSFRPGDVLRSRKGLTVENRNTDAEGRLILADALEFANIDDPDLIVDFATLTGAARVAMGADVPPFFTDDDALAADLTEAGEEIGDPVWRLPLFAGYERDLGSAIADITNAPAGGMAGAITAALFLQRFVFDPARWVHFDVYGWAQKARPGRPEGAECHAALAVFRVLEQRLRRADA